MQLPKSPTSMRINSFGLLCSLLSIFWMRESELLSPSLAIIIAGCALAFPIIILEWIFLKPYTSKAAGLSFTQKNPASIKRTLIKLTGFYSCLLFVAFIYWLFPEYRGGYYDDFFKLLKIIAVGLCILAIPYFYLVDRAMLQPKDGYWHLGALLIGKNKNINWASITQLLLGWTVKLFFLPLMFKYSSNNLNLIIHQDITHSYLPFRRLFKVVTPLTYISFLIIFYFTSTCYL